MSTVIDADDVDDVIGRIGHNSVASQDLKEFVRRIEALEDERATVTTDIREVYAEAGVKGFDRKILRKLIAIRKRNKQEREEENALLETYMHALGMI